MNKIVQKSIRIALILFGLLFLFLAYKSLVNDMGEISFENLPQLTQNILNIQWDLLLFFLIVSYITINIGIYWNKIFKKISSLSISLAILFLTLSIFLFPLGSNADDISSSLQPSIDYILSNSFDAFFQSNSNPPDMDFKIIVSNNSQIENIYVNNITPSQTNLLLNSINISLDTYEEKETLAKVLITIISQEIEKNMPEAKDTPIPLSEFEETMSSQFDTSSFQSGVDVSLLNQFYDTDPDANLKLILSENTESFIINPSSLKEKDVNKIWDNLGLNNDTSYENKQKITIMFFASMSSQTQVDFVETPIPVPINSIKYMLPPEIKYIFNTSVLSDNISQRTKSIKKIRNYCEVQNLNDSEICNIVMMTEYENLMKTLSNSSQIEQTIQTNPAQLNMNNFAEDSFLNMSKFSTIQKVENQITDYSSKANLFLILYFISILIAFGSYYLHLKISQKKFSKFEIPYFMSYLNFLNFIVYFVLIFMTYKVLESGIIFDLFNKMDTKGTLNAGMQTMKELPLYEVVSQIASQIITISVWYLAFSVLLFLALLYINKKYSPKEDFMTKNEKNAKSYIEKYKEEYSRESIKDALIQTQMSVEEIEVYLKRYYDI
jgi:hypothetical protein